MEPLLRLMSEAQTEVAAWGYIAAFKQLIARF